LRSSSLIDSPLKDQLRERLGPSLEEDVVLAPLTTIRIGGPAALFFKAQSAEQLLQSLASVRELGLPYWLLGGGSNVVISDEGLDGLVIFDANREQLAFAESAVTISSGFALADLVEECRRRGLSGIEFAVGIPGSIGGAVCGNAGAYGSSIGERLVEAEVWTPECGVRRVGPAFFDFAYRDSVLKHGEGIVLSATFRVEPGDPGRIEAALKANLKRRWERLPPPELPCAGSFFKNLPPEHPGEHRRAAGLFLERAGAKGLRVGGAQVYEKHANIIVNTGGATARDVRALAGQMKNLVQQRFGITLEEEARYLGTIA
jgi:UDP-N-acetylmuramate dehydrogenase